ncbi:MAG: mevalonate kinase [Gammaproteobacteria bacterium]
MFEISVPGSVMLMGEHAVLHGYPAIVAAINRRITVTLVPRSDKSIYIDAENFGKLKLTLDPAVKPRDDSLQSKKFRYVIAAIKQFKNKISSGFDLRIRSDFSDKLGLGSSAAVTVATLAVLQKWISQKVDLDKIYESGIKTVHAVQNALGSGADIAASVYGGIVAYQLKPLKIEQLQFFPEIALIYTGYKTPTTEVIKQVNESAENAPDHFKNLYRMIGDLVLKGIECFKQENWQQLGKLFLQHFEVQRALGVSDAEIEKIIAKLNNMPQVYGAKISGAGLGDCVLALMGSHLHSLHKRVGRELHMITHAMCDHVKLRPSKTPYLLADVKIDPRGIICS